MVISYKHSSILRKIFPAPSYLSLNTFGLDISPKSVKVMKLKQTKYGCVPEIFDEVQLKEICSLLESEKDLENCDELRNAIISLRDKYKIKFVSVSLPELKTYIFKTNLPIQALDNLEQAVKFKLEENVPLSPEDVLFNYAVNHERGDSLEVTVSALPKSVIETCNELLKSIDLLAVSFESESHALARSVIKHGDKESYLLIHMGMTKINLSIVENNIVQYASSIPIGSEEITKDLNGNEAQILKEQINKLLIYWFTNEHDPHQHEKIEVAILAGKINNYTEIVNFLEKHLRLSVHVANVWSNCFSLDDYIPAVEKKISLDYGIAVGLALIDRES